MIPGSMRGLLARMYDWLACGERPQRSEVIFVLAGRECRKAYGLQLLEEGWAETTLLSVGRFEIRRFSNLKLPVDLDLPAIASGIMPRQRHYFVTIKQGSVRCQKIDLTGLGTLSEVRAFAGWLTANAVRSAMVVTSGFHIRRVRLCCRKLVPSNTKLTFIAAAENGGDIGRNWWCDPHMRKLVLAEVVKLVLYRLLLYKAMPVTSVHTGATA